ncbi:MAG: hypothetical protein ACREMX_17715, partial [Gemmatimonadales bacterium]
VRSRLLRILMGVGAPAGPPAAARLPGAPWFVQRNILMLLGKLGSWPEGFTPRDYIGHSDPRVRREAYRLLVDDPATKDSAIEAGLADSDPGVLDLVLRAAPTACPPAALPQLERILRDASQSSETRVLALKALVGSKVPDAVARLLAVATQRRWWGSTGLASKSPVLLASLAALAEGWGGDPQVAPVLALAARHRDPEIRASVGARQSS